MSSNAEQATAASSKPVFDEVNEQGTTHTTASERVDQARDQVSQARDQLVEGYHAMEERAEHLKDQASEFNRSAVHFIRTNPALSIAGAFGVGYLLGSIARRRWIV